MLLFLFGSSGDHSVTVVVFVSQEITMLLFLLGSSGDHSVAVVVLVPQELTVSLFLCWFVR